MGRVQDKVVLVTGAASNPGLGYAAAMTLAGEGAQLIVTDVDIEGAELCAQDIQAAGGSAVSLPQDVASEDDWATVMDFARGEFGGLDVLVNNAGIAVLAPLKELTLAQWQRQIDVNLTSVFLGCKYAVEPMQLNGGGSIINLSSVAGMVGIARCTAYGAAKGGVRIMTKSIAVELAPDNIRCNSIHPGVIWTNMQAQATGLDDPSAIDPSVLGIPLQRPGEPQDIAHCVLYLASDESSYVTGAEFVIDAGMTAQ